MYVNPLISYIEGQVTLKLSSSRTKNIVLKILPYVIKFAGLFLVNMFFPSSPAVTDNYTAISAINILYTDYCVKVTGREGGNTRGRSRG